MKKFFQIIGIAIGSLVGIVVAAAAVAIWCVFTPERVTPVVRSVADQYITCEWDMDNVELTFFSTFPEFGLRITDFYLVNPMPEAQSDTVLTAPEVVAKLNVMALIKNKNLVVRELSLRKMNANIYLDKEGTCNADVFYFAPDTTAKDTSEFILPFDSIIIHGCAVEAQRLSLVDRKDTIDAMLSGTSIRLNMDDWDDIRLQVESKVESLRLKEEEYAHQVTLRMDIPAEVDLNSMYLRLKDAQVALNSFQLGIDGECNIGDTIPMDITIEASNWEIKPLLALLPGSITASLKDIDVDGQVDLNARAKGQYSKDVMPMVDARVQIKKGSGRHAALPYTFEHVQLDADAHLDLNRLEQSKVVVKDLQAKTLESEVRMNGVIVDLMNTMQTTAHVQVDAAIEDWEYFLPKTLEMNGRVKGNMDASATLAELSKSLRSVHTTGEVEVKNLSLRTDSLAAEVEQATLHLDANMKHWPEVETNITLASNAMLKAKADSMDVEIKAPKVNAQVQVNIEDTTGVPTIQADVQWESLQGGYKDYHGRIGHSALKAKMTTGSKMHKLPVFKGTLSTHDIDVYAMENHLVTKSIDIDVKSLYNEHGKNFLLVWNPMMHFCMNGAEVDITGFEEHVTIPQIIFKYSNRDFDILSSNVILGHSDFSLTGNIHKIGKWLNGQDKLTGEINFVSNHTDVNELLELFSADHGSEETQTITQTKTQTKTTTDSTSGPFLVPNDVDLTLNTQIKEAEVMNQVAKNLGGRVYVKNGTLVLEEVGFVCDAAKLQLTAIYRTPRRNHIYLGLDYHMLDVKIDQLIDMIPQIDSMVPMLKAFKGEAEFHLAAETYLTDQYKLKTSTLRGACSLFGKDLVVMDSETFDKISKLLSFKKKTENKVDSISAEITLYKDEIDIYPFCVSIDNYMAALGGRHNLDMSFDYHVNLLKPIYLGVDINGNMDNLSIKPAKCIYAKDFKPVLHNQVDSQNVVLRQIIRSSLRQNVKIQ